jgi:hypothetical protein
MMAKPLEKIKKIRSLDEIITRGGQAFSVYREQRRGGQILSDEEFARVVDRSGFGSAPIIAETLWKQFYKNADECFFPSFKDPEGPKADFMERFPHSAEKLIAAAEKMIDGRIDLLGLKNLYVGTDIDWHREPVSAKRSPLKHWKEFDDVDCAETGNKKVIWELNRHQHFFTLGAAFWLTGDERFAKLFAAHLNSWMEQNPPGMGINWASSLEVSLRAISWIWAFSLFRHSDHFTPELFHRATKFLYAQGRHIEQYLSKYYSPNTHLTGEGLGLYYLGTQLPFLERAKQWRDLGEDILVAEVEKQLHPDGVYFEQSTWYQRYTVDFYSHFVLLRKMFGGAYYDAPAAAVENQMQRAFAFLMTIMEPDGSTPIIGDDDGGRMLPLTGTDSDDFRGSVAVGAMIFRNSEQKFMAGSASEEIFWLMGPDGIEAYDSLPPLEPQRTSEDFPDGGYSVMRDGWSDTDNYLMVDCGEVGSLTGGHGHADALSIEVAVHGRSLLVDSGTYTYHESSELRDYFRSSMAHNTLVIDRVSSSVPGGIFAWKDRADAAKKAWIAEERFDFFEGSHDGYERLASPATHTRSILFLKNDYWIIRDLVETEGQHEYSLNFHFDHGIKTEIFDGARFVGGDDHRLFTFGDNGSWQQKESWISKNHGNRVNAPFLRFISSGEGKQEFFTFIFPADAGIDPPEVAETAVERGRAFVIRFGHYTDVFVFDDTNNGSIDNGIFRSDFAYSWARLSPDETVPDEFVLIDGQSIEINGNDLSDGSHARFTAVRRLGNDLYINSDGVRRTGKLDNVDRRIRERRRADSDRRKPDAQ